MKSFSQQFWAPCAVSFGMLVTVLAGAAIPLGIFALAIKRDQAIFDATSGTVTLQRRTLFGYRCMVHPLQTVRRAEMEALSDTKRPTLTFHDQTPPYPLVEAYTSGNAPYQTMQAINDWLWAARRENRASTP